MQGLSGTLKVSLVKHQLDQKSIMQVSHAPPSLKPGCTHEKYFRLQSFGRETYENMVPLYLANTYCEIIHPM